jgi:four helix bundle protein
MSANHRAVRRSRSTKEFAAKLGVVHEEADETVHWLTIIHATNRDESLTPELGRLLKEGTELRSLFAASRRTTRERYGSSRRA